MIQIGIIPIVLGHRYRALAIQGPAGPSRPMSGYLIILNLHFIYSF